MISFEIERLITFGLNKGLIKEYDIIPVRNALMDLLNVAEPYEGKAEYAKKTASEILKNILDYCAESGLIRENSTTYGDLFEARIMGLLMPRQSEVVEVFYENYKKSPELATGGFYKLSEASNYIRTDCISKNAHWKSKTEYGELEITINLSKPEKDPKEIAAAKSAPQTNYPKCLLCAENAGFAGTLNHPARQNHRIIPVTLQGQRWYFQYSPYVYYNEHCIVLNSAHTPMKITETTFLQLFEFIEKFPHYFIGSNADLPIVGGSILVHDHFQGGRHVFPMEKAKPYKFYSYGKYGNVKISLVKWPMSVIRISGADTMELVSLAMHILNVWRDYSDSAAEISAYTGETPHNTVTPIARMNKNGLKEMDIVLRNNRTSAEHPLGIFHPHERLHHVKKENIGLIEVMGLAVLPGRLKEELENIRDLLNGGSPFDIKVYENVEHKLYKHLDWIARLTEKYGVNNSKEAADAIIREETAKVFKEVLSDAGVFKDDARGKAGFDRFLEALGFGEIKHD